jgi:Long-chain fatty aldehyde decarbonylase
MVVDGAMRSCLTWDYSDDGSRLRNLYEKNKSGQWNASTGIDWDISVGEIRDPNLKVNTALGDVPFRMDGSPVPEILMARFRHEYRTWMISQFLHGEQGALVTTARLVEIVPELDAKLYAASQVGDEARHVEAYARYLDEKLGESYPVNNGLRQLLADLLSESRWDVVYLGMQVVVEGLALAAFRISNDMGDPLIDQITRAIARDEARHVGSGAIVLHGLYDEMTDREVSDREEFLMESIHLMSERFLLREVWEAIDVDVDAGIRYARTNETVIAYRQLLFTKVIQILRQVGLLTPRIHNFLDTAGLIRPGLLHGREGLMRARGIARGSEEGR